jgi:ribosomal protein S18 acetylase RimI-like enzyme
VTASFEPYEPQPVRRHAPVSCVVTPITEDDVPVIAELAWRRDGGSRDEHRGRVATWCTSEAITLVAREASASRVLGFGRAAVLDAGPCATSGWYLNGLVVAPEARRRGVGERLTLARIWLLAARGVGEVRCAINARNRASIALYERLGFALDRRVTELPGVTFEGGNGLVLVVRPGS